jgi:hypothetical protein
MSGGESRPLALVLWALLAVVLVGPPLFNHLFRKKVRAGEDHAQA